MTLALQPQVAIVDYELGNLFSVRQACLHAGLAAQPTSDSTDIATADAVVLPGVGAFGDAMRALAKLGLTEPLKRFAASGRPLLGVCLGLQLLMQESSEFGRHEGLGMIKGPVVRLPDQAASDGDAGPGTRLKVPQVGWNRVFKHPGAHDGGDPWTGSLLEGLENGCHMYFVHSYYVEPTDGDVVVATTTYGELRYCSALRRDNVFGCQFHPERSGVDGLAVYRNLAAMIGVRPV